MLAPWNLHPKTRGQTSGENFPIRSPGRYKTEKTKYCLTVEAFNKKDQGREQLTNKVSHDQKIQQQSDLRNISISSITIGSMLKILAPWILNPKTQNQISEELFPIPFSSIM